MGRGCCTILHLHEDNARFLLLAILLVLYLLLGAGLFHYLESHRELQDKLAYRQLMRTFRANLSYCLERRISSSREHVDDCLHEAGFGVMLEQHAEAYLAGLVEGRRPRWDYSGAFYFVGTVISTIGFGMTTPRTIPGKVALIAYGFLGCAGAILFFNLFLERIITFWAFILRFLHQLKVQRRSSAGYENEDNRGDKEHDKDSLESWKPSVFKVQFLLLFSACVIAVCASAMYYPVEGWSFFDAIYFCFVAFATIGFGDLVVSQKESYPNQPLYRIANFLFIVCGCCCIYSFFNVTSLVIRTGLDVIIKNLNRDCNCCKPRARTRTVSLPRGRRNAITEKDVEDQAKDAVKRNSVDSTYDSDENSNYSDEMISMQDFLRPNKVHLIQLQKQLEETANRGRNDGFRAGVGPLALVTQAFGTDE